MKPLLGASQDGAPVAQRGINLVGHITSNLGLGVAARNTASLLAEMGTPFVAVDVATTLKFANRVATWDDRLWTRHEPAPNGVNLFHVNPRELAAVVRFRERWLSLDGRVNAIVPFWELSHFPPTWVEVLRRVDVVLAPTRFVAELCEEADLGDVEIVHFPQSCVLPEGVAPDRARWGFADGDVVFVTSFDLNSDLSRKNPVGTVAAFRAMLEAADPATAKRARLVIKVNNPKGDRFQASRLAELHAIVGNDPAIRIIAEGLPYADVLSLYASADVFISLHRSEGLGLGLLESMMLGVPVIATAYSGNLDFMTPADSRLVKYSLVPVEGTSIGAYDPRQVGAGQMWAEPNVDDAADAMLELMDDARRGELAIAARAAARAVRENPGRRAAIERLLVLADRAPTLSALSDLQKLPSAYWRARALAGATLRAAGLRP